MKQEPTRVYGDTNGDLVVDDLGVEYVGKQHAEHLATIFKNITISLKIGKAKSMLVLI